MSNRCHVLPDRRNVMSDGFLDELDQRLEEVRQAELRQETQHRRREVNLNPRRILTWAMGIAVGLALCVTSYLSTRTAHEVPAEMEPWRQQEAVLDSLADFLRGYAPRVVQDRDRRMLTTDDVNIRLTDNQWLQLVHDAANVLLDDEARNAYAHTFVPELTRFKSAWQNKQSSDRGKEEALKRLCDRG
ncbi:hypothetical protein NM208_g5940 [Fusarium decemcellulare]|uniref:Uncharacterized protein n=1 Tax=Fusarium decemcellulare TaxID=57161 RepID=A0ACC1SFC8_9HYPO|nr:hypothetical protein NM208_g5940 [Fusarium decemcellulare]